MIDNSKTRPKGQSKVSDGTNESDYQGRVLSAIEGFCAGRQKGHTRKRSGGLPGVHAAGSTQRPATQAHRHTDGLSDTQAGARQGRGLQNSLTPNCCVAAISINTNSSNFCAGVKTL